jgi:hypothetical protein
MAISLDDNAPSADAYWTPEGHDIELGYQHPDPRAYNQFGQVRASFEASIQQHIREQPEDATEGLRELEAQLDEEGDLDEEDRQRLERLRMDALLQGWHPDYEHVEGFFDLCDHATVEVSESFATVNGEVEYHELADDQKRSALLKLFEAISGSPEERMNLIFSYARTIAQGLGSDKKKNFDD